MQRARVIGDGRHIGPYITQPRAQPFGNGARTVIQIPIEAFRQDQPLRRLQPKRMHIRQEHQQRCQLHATPRNAEFSRLLHGIDRIGAGIGHADHLGP